jgi:hypothetical protein
MRRFMANAVERIAEDERGKGRVYGMKLNESQRMIEEGDGMEDD